MLPDRADGSESRNPLGGDAHRRRLAEIAASQGERVLAAGNRPVVLDNPGRLWFVERGALDVFLVGIRNGMAEAPFRHALRLKAGRLVFGAAGNEDLRLLAKGVPDTVLRRIPAVRVTAEPHHDTDGLHRILADDADNWIAGILSAIAAQIEVHPRPDMLLSEGAGIKAGGVLTSAGGVVWVRGGEARLLDTEEPKIGELVPITRDSWALLHGPAEVEVLSSRSLGAEMLLSRAMPGFHRLAFGAEVFNRRLLLADQANLQIARSSWRHRDEDDARGRLFGLLGPTPPPSASADGELIGALRMVGRHERIEIRAPGGPRDEPPDLSDLLHASGVRARRVRLALKDRWWRGDSGAMLAFRGEDGGPVALVPRARGRYRLHDPATGASSPIGRAVAATLSPDAYVFYRPLPGDRPIGAKDLLAAASGRAGADLARIVAAGLVAGILTLAPAAGVGVLIGRVIPSGDDGALLRLALLLMLLAISAALAHVLRGMAVMRVEGQLAARATAALWDRLLRLPIRFYRKYSSGEISVRALAFQNVRDRLSGATGAALLSVLFLVPSIALVFVYDSVLGSLSMGVGLVALAVTVGFGVAQRPAQQRRLRAERRLAGHLSQLIECVRKLQAAGAEGSARASWARCYREQKVAEIRIGVLNEHLTAFGAAVPLLAAAVLFAAAYGREEGALGVGDFLVAYVASMIFYASIVALGTAFESIASVGPACEQILPILVASPESGARTGPPIVLAGALRFESVSFRYDDTGPPVLDGVDIHANRGEFIAIVGESGAGKSTLVRLALGLETPTGGAVYYDNRDLAHLDPVSVRRQVGAVLQDGGAQTGTVLDNIIGLDRGLTVDDAWRAARRASVDREIAAMPMQMHTSMGERAAVVSGGQSQRIRIARALVRDPRIVILDEATNWLDRRNQSALMEGIRNSTATRIVVAHRLSTIREADRIYVLDAGKVVQIGQFDELADADGPFRDLVHRQLS